MSVNLNVMYEVEVVKGKRIVYIRDRSRSLLKNFIAVLRGIFTCQGGQGAGASGIQCSETVTLQNGSQWTIWGGWFANTAYWGGGVPIAIAAPNGDDSYGIIVGSGNVPVTPDDYKLASKITHGTGLGQLLYGDTFFDPVSVVNNVSSFRVTRTFTNNSGSSVTVQELGIVAWNYWKDAHGVHQSAKFLILRDVLASPVSVPDGATLTVRYTFQVTA